MRQYRFYFKDTAEYETPLTITAYAFNEKDAIELKNYKIQKMIEMGYSFSEINLNHYEITVEAFMPHAISSWN